MNIQLPPKPLIYLAIVVTSIALIPPVLIYQARSINSPRPRIHYIQDMDNQPRFKTQQANDLFVDGRASRPLIEGTVARGEAKLDEHYWKGWSDGGFATTYPDQVEVTMELLERGRERYDIYCSVCHGQAGYGDGMVHKRATELVNNPLIGNGTVWVAPKNIHETAIAAQPVGQIYNTVTKGIRTMRGYEAQVPVEDRWAITAYVKALQRSQAANLGDLDPSVNPDQLELNDLRPELDEEAPADAAAAANTDAATPNGAAS